MRKYLHAFLLLWGITYVLYGCGIQPVDDSSFGGGEVQGTAEAEPSAVTASDTAPTQRPVPSLPPSPSPEPTQRPVPDSPVSLLDYGEYSSSLAILSGTEGYEDYLEEDLYYHEAYNVSEDGTECWCFDICLPRFAENMPCHRELNAYFDMWYERLLHEKEDFYDWIEAAKEEGNPPSSMCYLKYSYRDMTIGEQYLTVYVVNTAYYDGRRDYFCPLPVTFDLTTGEPVTLPEILNCSEQETKELVADYVYGYFISQGKEYVRRETYLCFETRDFYMLEQGLGVYYPRYAIDCGAAGDFLFIIPYEDLYEKASARAFSTPKPPSPVTEIDYEENSTVISSLPGSEGYEAYLEEDMIYHDICQVEKGDGEQGTFDICLPQFKGSMPCHEQINAYFVEWFADALDTKEEYYAHLQARVEGEREDQDDHSYKKLYYEGMTIGERYLTVYTVWTVHDRGTRDVVSPVPVTFDLTTGKAVTLPELLGCSGREASRLVDDYIYAYYSSQGIYSWWGDVLWFDPEEFYMLEQGLGVYYHSYTIDMREHLFIIPYEEFGGM